MTTSSNCSTCAHKQHPQGGWCYMFRREPEGVCARHTVSKGQAMTTYRIVAYPPTTEMLASVDQEAEDKYLARGRAVSALASMLAASPQPDAVLTDAELACAVIEGGYAWWESAEENRARNTDSARAVESAVLRKLRGET